MTRLYAVPLLLTLACATMHPRPVPDQGSGGSVPHANYLLQSIEGQAMAPVGSPSWFGKAYSLTLSAPSGQRAVQLTSGAFLDLGSGANDYIYSTGTDIQTPAGFISGGLFATILDARGFAVSLSVAGGAADSSASVGVVLNSPAYSTVGSKLASIRNNGTEKANFRDIGALQFTGIATVSLPTCNAGYAGAIIYDTTALVMKFCNGSAWTAM